MTTFNIPKNWLKLNIGDIADVIAGGTPKAAELDNFAESGTAHAWLTPADLSKYNKKYISYGKRDLSQKGLDTSSAKLMPKGTILFSSRAPIGYVAVANNEISTNQGFKSFIFSKQVNSTFAYYYLRSIRDIAESRGSGTTFKELSGANAKKLPFILAPLAEQKQIASKLDELLTQVEIIKTRLDTIPNILKHFRQSVLAAAVSGKLTEEWRKENNDKLLKHENALKIIEIEYLAKKKADQKRVDKAHNSEWFYSCKKLIPNSWHEVHLIDVTSLITCGVAKKPNYIEEGIPFLSAQNSKPFSPNLKKVKYISEADFKTFTVGGKPEKGDVLYSRVGANYGEACQIPWDFDFSIYVSLTLIKPIKSLLNGTYLTLFLNSHDGVLQSRGGIMGSGLQNLNVENVRKYKIPLPPLEEQSEVVRRVEELFVFSEQVEQRVKDAQVRVNSLTHSILAKAFRGELTTEWREQNPDLISGKNSSEVLLEKIKLEKKTASVALKSNRSKPKYKVTNNKKVNKKDIKIWIKNISIDKFSFEVLAKEFNGSTDEMQKIIFSILEEDNPVIKQKFDSVTSSVIFEKVKQ